MRDPLPLRHSVPTPPPGIVVEPSPIRGLAADTSIRRIFGHSHFGLFHPYAVALRRKNSILMEAEGISARCGPSNSARFASLCRHRGAPFDSGSERNCLSRKCINGSLRLYNACQECNFLCGSLISQRLRK